jgi:hypothetical protein
MRRDPRGITGDFGASAGRESRPQCAVSKASTSCMVPDVLDGVPARDQLSQGSAVLVSHPPDRRR